MSITVIPFQAQRVSVDKDIEERSWCTLLGWGEWKLFEPLWKLKEREFLIKMKNNHQVIQRSYFWLNIRRT